MAKKSPVPFDLSQLPTYLERELNRLDGELLSYATKDYIPAWTGATTNPVLGNGSLMLRYRQVNDLCELWFYLTMGSTTTYGTGEWRFQLPIAGRYFYQYGTATFRDSSSGVALAGVCEVRPTDSFLRFRSHNTTLNTDVASPFAWAVGDVLAGHIRYMC